MRISFTRRLAIAAFLAPVLLGASAFHLALKRAEPAKDARVAQSPAALHLWFTEAPELAVTRIRLATAAGGVVKIGPVARDTAADASIVAPIPQRLAPGAYTVQWSTMAHDGHPVHGSYGFTVTR